MQSVFDGATALGEKTMGFLLKFVAKAFIGREEVRCYSLCRLGNLTPLTSGWR